MCLIISEFVIVVQSCGQISDLVESVAQHCHQDPPCPPPASYFCQTAVTGLCLHLQAGRKMAAVVPGVTEEPRYFQRKMSGHRPSPWFCLLGVRSFSKSPPANFSLWLIGQMCCAHFLHQSLARGIKITFSPIRSIPRAGTGLRVP